MESRPAQKVKFFEEIFIPAYNAKERPDEKNGKEEPLQAVTTRELSDYYRKVTGKSISTDNLKKQFLDELKVNDLIGEMKSEIDGRRSIFYPLTPPVPVNAHEKIKKLSNEDIFDDISYFQTLELSRDYKYIPENWLILEILSLEKYRIDFAQAVGPFADYLNQSENLKFLKINNLAYWDSHTRLSIREFILKYESPSSISIRYIFKADFYGFYSENIGFMREVCLLDLIRYKKMSNHTAFDNFAISNRTDISQSYADNRASTNNLFYSKYIISKNQAAYSKTYSHFDEESNANLPSEGTEGVEDNIIPISDLPSKLAYETTENKEEISEIFNEKVVNREDSHSDDYDLVHDSTMPHSAPSAKQPPEALTYSCAYCNISNGGSATSFITSDLLERHVVTKHAGWTAYPGAIDIQKFELREKEKD